MSIGTVIWIVIITLAIYSTISTIVFIATNENDDVAIAFGLGIVGLLLMGITTVIRKTRDYFKYHFNRRSIFIKEETGEKFKCKTSDTNDVNWVDGYKLEKRYATKEEYDGIPDFSKEFIEMSKRNCDHCKHDKECTCNYPYVTVKCKHDGYGRVLEFDKFEKISKR